MSKPTQELSSDSEGDDGPTRLAAFYDAYWTDRGRPPIPTPPPAVDRLIRKEIARGSACLDVGCGNGQAAGPLLTAMGCRYVGVDLSTAAIEAARALGLDARKIADAATLPFNDGSFDAVLALETLEHLMFPEPAVAEMRRVLKPGGVLLVTTPNVGYWRRRLEHMAGRWNPFGYPDAVRRPWADPHIRFFTPASLGRLLQAVGFVDIHVAGHGGTLLADIPRVGRRFRRPEASALYRAFERTGPSLLGCFLNATGRKPRV